MFENGNNFELSRRKGSWVVLNFFTHDCVPCIREHPELIEFVDQQRALGVDGAEFYSVVRDSTVDEVNTFFAERGGDWPIVYDHRYEFVNGFGVALVPETWIIDPNGFVRRRFISEVTADGLSGVLQSMRDGAPVSASSRRDLNRRLKGWPGWVVLAFVVVGFLAVGATRDTGPRTPDDRIESISKRLACPVCQGESVYESRNTASNQIREAVGKGSTRAPSATPRSSSRSATPTTVRSCWCPPAAVSRRWRGATGDRLRARRGRVDGGVPAMAARLASARRGHPEDYDLVARAMADQTEQETQGGAPDRS